MRNSSATLQEEQNASLKPSVKIHTKMTHNMK